MTPTFRGKIVASAPRKGGSDGLAFGEGDVSLSDSLSASAARGRRREPHDLASHASERGRLHGLCLWRGRREPQQLNGGFTLVELLIATLLLAIFLTFASVNWDAFTPNTRETFIERFSMEVSLLREEAISDYDEKAIEFNIVDNVVTVGRIDKVMGFVKQRELPLPDESRMKDLIVNGESFSTGKPLMTFYPTGAVDRIILHLDLKQNDYYSISINPLTAKITGEEGYIEEIKVRGRNNPS